MMRKRNSATKYVSEFETISPYLLRNITNWVASKMQFDPSCLHTVTLRKIPNSHNSWNGRAGWWKDDGEVVGSVRINISESVSYMRYRKMGPWIEINGQMEALVVAMAHELCHLRLAIDAGHSSTGHGEESWQEEVCQRWERRVLEHYRKRKPILCKLWEMKHVWLNRS